MSYRLTFDDRTEVISFVTLDAATNEFHRRREAGQRVYLEDDSDDILAAYHDDFTKELQEELLSWPTEDEDMDRMSGVFNED